MHAYAAQVIAVSAANLAMISAGVWFGWSSPSLQKLVNDESDLVLTSDQFGWVSSFLNFGCILGPLLSAQVVDRIGRKWTLHIAMVPILFSWLMIGLAQSYEVLCTGRFIAGLGVGSLYALIPMYAGEVADDKIRGGIGTLMNALLNLGFVIAYSTGPWLSRQMLAVVSAIPPLLFYLTFFWMPETPYYLLMKDKRDEARSSLKWFRRREDVEEELNKMEHSVKMDQQNRSSILELLQNAGNRRALIIVVGLVIAQQFSGVHAIQAYASSMFEQSGLSFSSSVSVIIIGIVKLTTGLVMVLVTDLLGRRPILNTSSIGTAIFLGVIAIFYNLQAVDVDVSNVSWLPLFGTIGFYLAYTGGLSNLPQAILGELFPTNVKAWATMIMAMFAMACGAVMTKLYQVVADAFGTHVAFYGFMVCTMLGGIFIYFFVPETKGRSLQEIQDMLNRRTESTEDIVKK